jgi:hypothetical protein
MGRSSDPDELKNLLTSGGGGVRPPMQGAR